MGRTLYLSVCHLVLFAFTLINTTVAQAADFTIKNGQTVTTTQTLSNNDETGTVEEGGTISTTGTLFNGIESNGANANISNAGTISIAGDFSNGIDSNGVNANISNTGTISVTGDFSNGIDSIGANANISNAGTISITGDFSDGIISSGDNANISNTGAISTTGDNSPAIESKEDNANISNTGTISTTGAGSSGILSTRNNATITNNGRIFATAAATAAIKGEAGNETLNILSGSQIRGIIDLGGGNNTVNLFSGGAGPSFTLSIIGATTINGVKDNIVNTNGIVQLVDPTGQSINGAVLGFLTAGIHGTINNRLLYNKTGEPTQIAASRLEPGMLSENDGPQVWLSGFGAHRERGLDGRTLAYEQQFYGFSGGYEAQIRRYRIGLVGGYAHSDVETNVASIETDTDSLFLGGYGQIHLGEVTLSANLLGGYEDHTNDRRVLDNLSGFETAQADFDSLFLSPSFTVSTAIDLGSRVELRPSATLIYSVSWHDDYTESGTTRSNLSVGDRTVQALIGRVQLAAGYKIEKNREMEVRFGGRSRYTDNDDTNATLAGASFRYASVSDDAVFGGYVGGNFRVALMDRLILNADFEYGEMEGNEDYTIGQLGLQFNF